MNLDSICYHFILQRTQNLQITICHCMILSKNIIQSHFFIHWLLESSVFNPFNGGKHNVTVQKTTYMCAVEYLDLWYLQVAVRVHNRLQTEGVSFHWHGLLQRSTPWMDGVPMVSQCPILPGQVFQYRWDASFPRCVYIYTFPIRILQMHHS